MKLEVELVPSSCFYTNLRSILSKGNWDRLRKYSYEKANLKCEICGESGLDQGSKHALECHEVWAYDDVNLIQSLVRVEALCPRCHEVKHIGLAGLKGHNQRAVDRLK